MLRKTKCYFFAPDGIFLDTEFDHYVLSIYCAALCVIAFLPHSHMSFLAAILPVTLAANKAVVDLFGQGCLSAQTSPYMLRRTHMNSRVIQM